MDDVNRQLSIACKNNDIDNVKLLIRNKTYFKELQLFYELHKLDIQGKADTELGTLLAKYTGIQWSMAVMNV